MNQSLVNYIRKYDCIDKLTCQRIIKEIEFNDWTKHNFYDAKNNISVSHKNDLEVCDSEISYNKLLMEKIWETLSKYICNELEFPWFPGWTAFTRVRYNRYSENTSMLKHCDHIQSIFDGNNKGIPILSIVGFLNDEFEGGDFIFFDDFKIKTEPGTIIIFPSNFLYPHQVTTVTSGTRYSFVSWAW